METFLDRARQLGCDGVSLESCFFPEFGETYLTTLRRRLDALEFDRVYAWGHPDGLEAGGSVKAKEEMLAHIEYARLIGAPVMRVVGSSLMFRFEPHEPQLKILAEWFKEATDRAAAHGIRLAVENHIDYNSDEILWLIEQVGSDHFGLNGYPRNTTPEMEARRVSVTMRRASSYSGSDSSPPPQNANCAQRSFPAVSWQSLWCGAVYLLAYQLPSETEQSLLGGQNPEPAVLVT